jgi:hypothetical protein
VPLVPEPIHNERPGEMQETPPEGWFAHEILEGRIIFHNNTDTTWTHPDPHYDGPLYRDYENALEIVEPVFEASSYTWGSDTTQVAIEVMPSPGSTELVIQQRPRLY